MDVFRVVLEHVGDYVVQSAWRNGWNVLTLQALGANFLLCTLQSPDHRPVPTWLGLLFAQGRLSFSPLCSSQYRALNAGGASKGYPN